MSRHLRWGSAWAGVLALAVLTGCGGQEPLPPLSTGKTTAAQAPAPSESEPPATPKQMSTVVFPEALGFVSFATRGVTGWAATASEDRSAVTCKFTATAEGEAHYGGVALPIAGTKAFRLTVEFLEGAEAVKAIFVTALSSKGEEAGRWGYDVKALKGLVDGEAYTWEFEPGRKVGARFWAIPGKTSEHAMVHFFVDAGPGRRVSFVVAKSETET